MKLTSLENGILLEEIENFDPFVSCECGQCFRFERLSENEYSLVAAGRRLFIERRETGWLFREIDEKIFKKDYLSYFDLERDYSEIIKSYEYDKTVFDAASVGGGIRIFRQDPWETLISFIISQNNNIPRIKKIIEALCQTLGEEVDGVYLFPTAESIVKAGIEGLAPIKSGFRAKYIVDAAEKVLSGEISLERIAKSDYPDALEELKKIKGVGDKVGNCVLLFGFGFYEAFPVDVWVKRVINKYYGDNFDASSFGKYAGIAQQYLFYHERLIALGRTPQNA